MPCSTCRTLMCSHRRRLTKRSRCARSFLQLCGDPSSAWPDPTAEKQEILWGVTVMCNCQAAMFHSHMPTRIYAGARSCAHACACTHPHTHRLTQYTKMCYHLLRQLSDAQRCCMHMPHLGDKVPEDRPQKGSHPPRGGACAEQWAMCRCMCLPIRTCALHMQLSYSAPVAKSSRLA